MCVEERGSAPGMPRVGRPTAGSVRGGHGVVRDSTRCKTEISVGENPAKVPAVARIKNLSLPLPAQPHSGVPHLRRAFEL